MSKKSGVSWGFNAISRDVIELGALFLATGVADFLVTELGHGSHGLEILAVFGAVLILTGGAMRRARLGRRQGLLARAPRERPPPSVADQDAGDGVLWRIRTTVTDTPGRLAALCTGLATLDVNILAVHVHPHARPMHDAVVDEFLVMAPGDLGEAQIAAAIGERGGIGTEVWPFDGADLIDVTPPAWATQRPVVSQA